MNLGSPKSTSVGDVGAYLREFLMDPYVIDLPWLFRWFLVNVVIVPFRSPKSAQLYNKIWREETGSPRLHISKKFVEKLQDQFVSSEDIKQVKLAMRYGEPDLRATLNRMLNELSSIDKLYVLPMYPQYAESSTKSALVRVRQILRELQFGGEIVECRGFFRHPGFIECVTKKIVTEIETFQPDHLLLSYHGLPMRQVGSYRDECLATTAAISEELDKRGAWPKEKVSTGFQSRLNERWIQPFSDHFYRTLPAQGVRKLLVACPSFVADCLETLEEVAMRGRDEFCAHGGGDLRLVPCLNDFDEWVNAVADIVRDQNYWQVYQL